MPRTVVQQVEVTVDDGGNTYLAMFPVSFQTVVQQLAVSVGGTDQTVIVRPVE